MGMSGWNFLERAGEGGSFFLRRMAVDVEWPTWMMLRSFGISSVEATTSLSRPGEK